MTSFLLSLFAVAAEPAKTAEPAHPEMHLFFDYSLAAREATIDNDLEKARANMKKIAELPSLGEFPEDTKTHLMTVRSAAEAAANSTSASEMGHAVARIAAACGACHAATGGGPKLEKVGPPPKEKNLSEHMRLHAWSANMMWEGLVTADRARWEAGAKGLYKDTWIHSDAYRQSPHFSRRVHATGEAAMLASTDVERVALYGEFLAACAACHAGGE